MVRAVSELPIHKNQNKPNEKNHEQTPTKDKKITHTLKGIEKTLDYLWHLSDGGVDWLGDALAVLSAVSVPEEGDVVEAEAE